MEYGWTSLERLQAFDAVYRKRNMNAAARELGLGTEQRPNRGRVWQLIRDLTTDLLGSDGGRLFDPVPTGASRSAGQTVVPTQLADQLHPIVSAALSQIGELPRLARGRVPAALHMACFPAHVRMIVAELLPRVPDNIDLQEVDDRYRLDAGLGLLQLVHERDADVVIAPSQSAERLDSVVVYPWRLAAVGRRNLVADSDPVHADQLQNVPLLLSPAGHNSTRLVLSEFERLDVEPTILHQSLSTESLLAMADAGLGVAILPSDAIWDAPRRRIRWFGDRENCSGSHSLFWRKGEEHYNELLKTVVSEAKKVFTEQVLDGQYLRREG